MSEQHSGRSVEGAAQVAMWGEVAPVVDPPELEEFWWSRDWLGMLADVLVSLNAETDEEKRAAWRAVGWTDERMKERFRHRYDTDPEWVERLRLSQRPAMRAEDV